MTDLVALKRSWEKLATDDPFWVILTDPKRKGNRWPTDEFFETGRREIRAVLDYLERLGTKPNFSGKALDFGCGAGRLSQALAASFSRTVGVDISAGMVSLAERYNRFPDSCQYVCNSANVLPFQDNEFSFIYSSIVLQHIEPTYAANYIAEFLRVLAPGGLLVFQVSDSRKGEYLRQHAGRVRAKLRRFFAALGLGRNLWEVHCLGETRIREVLALAGGQIQDMQYTNSATGDFNGNLRFLTSEPQKGYVSKQYCVIKE